MEFEEMKNKDVVSKLCARFDPSLKTIFGFKKEPLIVERNSVMLFLNLKFCHFNSNS